MCIRDSGYCLWEYTGEFLLALGGGTISMVYEPPAPAQRFCYRMDLDDITGDVKRKEITPVEGEKT